MRPPTTNRNGGLWDLPLDPRVAWTVAISLILAHIALAWIGRPVGITTIQDDAHYVLLGQSLRSFHYRDLFLPGAPPHAKYPPGYPAVLAAWGGVGGDGYGWLVLPSLAAMGGALALVFAGLKRTVSPAFALLVLAPLSMNPWLVHRSATLFSEPVFMLLVFLGLWMASGSRGSLRAAAVAGAAIVAASLTRAIGLTLVLAVAVHWALDGRVRRAVVLAGAAALVVGLWLAWTSLAPTAAVGSSYLADAVAGRGRPSDLPYVLALAQRVAIRIWQYLTTNLPLRLAIPTIPGTPIDNGLAAGLMVVGLGPGFVLLTRRWRAGALYLFLYLGLLLLWPWQRGRFVEPILPLLAAALLLGVGRVAGLLGRRWGLATAAVLSVALTVAGGVKSVRAAAREAGCERLELEGSRDCLSKDHASFFDALAFARRGLGPGTRLLTVVPEPVYLYTGLPSVVAKPALRADPGAFLDYLRSAGATHILLGRLRSSEVHDLEVRIEANCRELDVAYADAPRTFIFSIPDSGTAAGDGGACRAIESYRAFNEGGPLPVWLREP
ncbi:MAG: hypothetical protein ACE5HF_00835 [Gemmatimonadota bacterium]